MKRMSLFAGMFLVFSGAAFAKEIKKDSPEYSNPKLWEVGDEVELLGKVVKKEVVGKTVKITLDLEGIKMYMEATL